MMVSVVIPTYNRKESLKKTLESLDKLNFDKNEFEVIVIDDGTEDGITELISSIKHQINMRYFYQEHKGASAARNLGIKHAKGEIIAFTDSDCIVDKNWLSEIIKPFQDDVGATSGLQLVAVYGKTISVPEKITPFTHQVINSGESFASCNIACKKTFLIKAGNFDENFIYGHEDTDIYFRLSKLGKIKYVPNAVVCHPPVPMSFLQFIKRIEISYRNEYLLYNKYPEIYKGRSFLCSLIRVIGIRSFIENARMHIRYLYRKPFLYILYVIGLIFQRVYLIFLLNSRFIHKL